VSEERYSVARFDEMERKRDGVMIPVRAHFGIEAFGVTAWTGGPGIEVITDHDEAPSGHQELYLVVTGRATFTVDGREADAPAGTFVFVGDPDTKRKAVAVEPETTVLAIGAKPGEPYVVRGWELYDEAMPFFASGEYERAYQSLAKASGEHPEMSGILYNLACAEALTGREEEAVKHLRRAIELDERFREIARADSDFDSIRSHPDFAAA
jgi:tetratricopeptide (TPR) repeat protein